MLYVLLRPDGVPLACHRCPTGLTAFVEGLAGRVHKLLQYPQGVAVVANVLAMGE